MRCPACSCDNIGGREFCAGCGAALQRKCPACGERFPLVFKYCGFCGAAVRGDDFPHTHRNDDGTRKSLSEDVAERRQLTILFCDLVGSTAIAEEMDPEDLRDAMRAYYALCEEVVGAYGGEISEVAGDGIVIHFGHPRAQEDAAERAIRAGLALSKVVEDMDLLPRAKVRIGIATGVMIVGDFIEAGGARERELVGSPVHLAARLQSVASPGDVVISESTRTIVGGAFSYADLGEYSLKGFAEKVRAYAIRGEDVAVDRFQAHSGAVLPPMVGRELERETLIQKWQRAKEGSGQIVLVSGEPGIGKSRLIRDFCERTSGDAHETLSFAGSLLHRHSTLYPVIHQIRMRAGIGHDDTTNALVKKLEAFFGPSANTGSAGMSSIAEFIGSAADLGMPSSIPSAERLNDQVLTAIFEFFQNTASHRPLVLVFEDLQWLDETTRELIDRVARRTESLPVLLIVTFRSATLPPWKSMPQATALELGPLAPVFCASVARRVAANKTLPDGFIEELVAKTDGVPLFVEELTKAILEAQERPGLSSDAGKFTVPATLRDTLMARLDRDRDARLVAQIASAIGREFSYELLAMIAPMPAMQLHGALDELLQSELIFPEGLPPSATYSFKHALIQEVAYDSQLRRRRRAIHRQIAATLEGHFPDTPPEVIGYHHENAGATEAAIDQYERAAEIARNRSANAEGCSHYARALDLLATLPPGADRDRREIILQIAYGAQQIAVKGNAAGEVGRAYRRALTLTSAVGDSRQTFRVLRGLQTYYMVRGQLPDARAIGERLLAEAEQHGDDDLLLQAHRPHGLCLLYMGELDPARAHLQRAVSLYDSTRHAEHRFLYGSDPGVLAYCNLAWVEWFLGNPERALTYSRTALALSESPEPHPHSKAFALSLAASLHQFRREAKQAFSLAESVIALADQHRFAYWGPWGHVIRGWARVAADRQEQGIEELRSGLEAYRATGAGLMCPYFLGLLADALKRMGRSDQGLAAVNEALELADQGEIRFYEPELYCVKAELLAEKGDLLEERAACLQQALSMATAQSSRILEVRALAALSRDPCVATDRSQVLGRMGEVLSSFNELESSKLVVEARAILGSTAP